MYNNKRTTNYDSLVRVTRVNQLNINNDQYRNVRPNRGGIILYTTYNSVLYFGLAVDRETHDLTDAGGTIDYSTDETAVRGCIREFSEETLNIFETVTEEHLKFCPVVYDQKNMIIFMHIAVDPNKISYKLVEAYKAVIEDREKSTGHRGKKISSIPEVCSITWLTKASFEHSLHTPGIMYSRVRKFLSQCLTKDLYDFL